MRDFLPHHFLLLFLFAKREREREKGQSRSRARWWSVHFVARSHPSFRIPLFFASCHVSSDYRDDGGGGSGGQRLNFNAQFHDLSKFMFNLYYRLRLLLSLQITLNHISETLQIFLTYSRALFSKLSEHFYVLKFLIFSIFSFYHQCKAYRLENINSSRRGLNVYEFLPCMKLGKGRKKMS